MRRFITAAAVTAATVAFGAPALAAVSADGPDPDDHLGATPAVEVEAAAEASASLGDAGDDGCRVIEETVGDDAVGGWTRTVVCVSSDGVSASASGSAHASSEGANGIGEDRPDPGDEPGDFDPRERIAALVDDLRGRIPSQEQPGDEPGDEPGQDDDGDLYHQVIEDTLGLDVYEDEVCDDRHDGYAGDGDGDGDYVSDYLVEEYAHDYVADCWVDDYLVGDYVRDYVLDYVNEQSPVDLGPATNLARDVIDRILGVTNAEGEEPSMPPAPPAPDAPTPDAPAFGVPDLGTPDLPLDAGDDLTDAFERAGQLRTRMFASP